MAYTVLLPNTKHFPFEFRTLEKEKEKVVSTRLFQYT